MSVLSIYDHYFAVVRRWQNQMNQMPRTLQECSSEIISSAASRVVCITEEQSVGSSE